MQVRLNDKDKQLLEQVDTSKMGWLNDPILDDSPTFKKLREWDREEAEYGRKNHRP